MFNRKQVEIDFLKGEIETLFELLDEKNKEIWNNHHRSATLLSDAKKHMRATIEPIDLDNVYSSATQLRSTAKKMPLSRAYVLTEYQYQILDDGRKGWLKK